MAKLKYARFEAADDGYLQPVRELKAVADAMTSQKVP
jgi:hypothetical protein